MNETCVLKEENENILLNKVAVNISKNILLTFCS